MALDFSNNGYEELFRKALVSGIDLFCGAEFSVAARNEERKCLELGEGLLSVLKDHFGEIKAFSSLDKAATKLERTNRKIISLSKRAGSVSETLIKLRWICL